MTTCNDTTNPCITTCMITDGLIKSVLRNTDTLITCHWCDLDGCARSTALKYYKALTKYWTLYSWLKCHGLMMLDCKHQRALLAPAVTYLQTLCIDNGINVSWCDDGCDDGCGDGC